jgi:hypothetical protein
MKTSKPRIVPDRYNYEQAIRFMREDAERSGESNLECAAYSILWFCGSGRAFTGFERVCSHMHRGTVKALVRRVLAGMLKNAKARGSDFVVTGDLTNQVLAKAIGCPVDAVSDWACAHPYGQPFTFGKVSHVTP